MSDILPSEPLPRDNVAALVAALPHPGFARALLGYVRRAADIASFGAFYVADIARADPVLSVHSGEMSAYWFNRNAQRILANDLARDDIMARIHAAGPDGLAIERWHPPQDDPRAPIYARDGVIERVTVSSRSGRTGFLSFYLRGAALGWLMPEEFDRLRGVLPLAHELIGLRHRIVGSEAFRATTRERASALRARGAGLFTDLSPREAEVCDHIANGVGVSGTALALGVSENTVRTLRRRAYRKLGVHSAQQLVALAMQDGATP
ncbi:LuxR C-terminal-related transcriptional regulator [Lutimaribacter marinistellae]|uniref:LuxR C-terminal-related transcriptional regulator n=1 Tax=Lutimaribacter marinistellae TaxID=1820329 RepID=A0ABV7TIA6_9RHOB